MKKQTKKAWAILDPEEGIWFDDRALTLSIFTFKGLAEVIAKDLQWPPGIEPKVVRVTISWVEPESEPKPDKVKA